MNGHPKERGEPMKPPDPGLTTIAASARPLPKPKWRERLHALRNIAPVFKMVWEAAPQIVGWNLAVRVSTALVPVTVLAVTRVIIDSIVRFTAHGIALPRYFWWLVALEFGLAGLSTIFARLIDFFDAALAVRYAHHVSVRTIQHASLLDLSCYEDPAVYDKLERARVQGTDRIVMIQAAGRWVQELITTASLAASIFLFSPLLLLALIACLVPAFLGETHFAFLGYSLNFQQTSSRRELEYLRMAASSKEGVKEVKLFGLGPFLTEKYGLLSDELNSQTVGLAKRKLIFGSLLSLLGTAGYYGTYAFVIYETVQGRLTIGTLTFLAGAIAGASANIQLLFSTFSTIADQALFLSDLLEFFAVKPTIASKPGALRAPRPIRRGFEFKNVSFSYPGSPRPILRDLNFTLGPRERVALVGQNGEGKTTIVKLLTRMYDVTSGQILLDGVDLREYDPETLWNEIGVIFQDFVRYEMPARDNIAIGRIAARPDLLSIRAAAVKSLADDVISKLPKHYEQILGSRFDGGVDLSGGEWQKVALARAYLRDAQLLILDEPTAALDARSEREVFERFAELTEGKISLLISHRFSTVRMAYRILVLDGGRISEQGPHDDLIQSGGLYAEMFEMQAASYR
jgi:ATP-binding cassette, subfamily B, bacterial